eukprot:gnl/MRDRNA2_/MRDRNA2_129701_c0_seq1.p1 gnl/MRDRNA2_/MRDRNA2_129701_c0~~gnl/MRDRNA2_/MRDRNA2_129701_c0_seq1.p1  ORF type:complete len:562 (-),score=97.63 gnl/MRDRNA2_/MRDRNA2_129701_c0_seq1:393-2078(-)
MSNTTTFLTNMMPLGPLWTWVSTSSTGKTGDNKSFTVIAVLVAYVLGTVIPVAVLALIVACCALCLSAAVLCFRHDKQKQQLNETDSVPTNKASEMHRETKPCGQESSLHEACEGNTAQYMPSSLGPRRNSGDLNSQNSSIIYYSQEDNLEQAHQALRTMRTQGNVPKLVAYSCFLNACARNCKVKLAEQCLAYMKEDGVELNNICYCTIINVYASTGDIDKAEQVFREMEAAGGEVAPNTAAYNALIKTCSRCQYLERAEFWLNHMKESRIEPNVITYTTLINACAKSKNAEGAEKWLGEMSTYGVEANIMTYNTVIDACAKVGDVARAEACFHRMKKDDVKPDIITYNSIINACGQAGNIERASMWLELMIKDGLEPCNVSFSICIGACVKVGDMAAANRWLTKMFSCGVELSHVNYSTLIHSAIKAADFDFAERILQHCHDQKLRTEAITYRAGIHALAKSNQSDRAEQWLLQMLQAHGMSMITSDDLFGPVISAFCNLQNAEAVTYWIEMMKKWNIPISQALYSKSIKVLQRTGNGKFAREYAQELKNCYSKAGYRQ